MYSPQQIITFFKKHIVKIVAVAFLLVLLVGTWAVFKKREFFNEELHISIQDRFQQIIEAKILKKNPLAKNITFHQLWTETVDQGNQIRAVFSYSFNDGSKEDDVDIQVSGTALLNRSIPSNLEGFKEKWEIDNFKVSKTSINFNKELIIAKPSQPKEQELDLDSEDFEIDDLEFDSPSSL